MTATPKVSIIIPVYNVEQYLRQCLDSLVNQTMREIQIICVNDGSTDGSLAILREYESRDSRMLVLDQPNRKQASARNAAYSHIKGKYTLFVDADDWIELDLCEKAHQKSEVTGAPMTIFFYQGQDGRSDPSYRLISPHDKTTVEEKLPLFNLGVVCDKLWRTDFLFGNRLYFPEGLVFEDTLVNWQAVTMADRISVVPERLYHYRRNPNSTMTTKGEHSLDMIPIYDKIREYLLASGYYAAYRDQFISKKLDVWFRHYRNLPTSLQPRYRDMIRKVISDDDREFYRTASKKQCKTVARLFYAMIDGDTTAAWKFRIAYTMQQIIRTPELLVRQWIVRPFRRWKDTWQT